MTTPRTFSGMILLACTLALFAGCRAKPAPDSGYLQNPKLMKAEKGVPYNRIYINPKYKSRTYNEIYVAPVNMNYVMAQNTWESSTSANFSKEDVKKNMNMLADYTRNAFIKAAEKDPKKHFKIVQTPGPNTLILEMAIVQLVPSKAELQALGLVPFFYLGPITMGVAAAGSTATGSEDMGKGVVAIEARARDGATGEVTGMFADRQRPPTTLLDIKALFWWEPAKPIVDAWARQFIELANDPERKKKIGEIPNFQFLVW